MTAALRETGPAPTTAEALLSVRGLTLDLVGGTAQPGLVKDVEFTVPKGRSVALIGESGCGKTLTAMAILGLLPRAVRVVAGEIVFAGTDLLTCSPRELRRIRGGPVGAVFQEPMSSLNPTMTVGDQIAEARRIHFKEGRRTAREHARALLDRVGIPDAKRRLDSYPHEMSGGMQQRVMIAAAIAGEPRLVVADEPTTALDVTIQAEILELLRDLQRDLGLAVLLVTHDLGVVADFCDEVVVMYAGHVVEKAPVREAFRTPAHPYTSALLGSVPQSDHARTPLKVIGGRVPPAGAFPAGCRFQPRCRHAAAACAEPQADTVLAAGHHTRCGRVAAGDLTPGRQL
ncbi:ABC transporter ATP-binding protein [Phytohabitans flavus]|uniref:ABC transporter ATP-binding protein n=1 Tax=Phytohabitans flavus TaxID=1076124 RepID=A0A6F8XSD8_9ACTN|nr:ABC transporter ATP-binding protein [Phytohabitans flavus]BCB76661.1 ABC transporter ATP-binding protein [Phytohabitans flavus]